MILHQKKWNIHFSPLHNFSPHFSHAIATQNACPLLPFYCNNLKFLHGSCIVLFCRVQTSYFFSVCLLPCDQSGEVRWTEKPWWKSEEIYDQTGALSSGMWGNTHSFHTHKTHTLLYIAWSLLCYKPIDYTEWTACTQVHMAIHAPLHHTCMVSFFGFK